MAAVARSGVDGLLQRIHPFEIFPVRRRLASGRTMPQNALEDVYRAGGRAHADRADRRRAGRGPARRPRGDGGARRWWSGCPTSIRPAIEEAYLGDANQAGEDNRNVARMAVLLAGLPVTIPGATVNRLCGSGLEAVMDASRAVAVGDADVVLAGGVESMSRAPWVLPKPAKGYPTGHEQLWSTTLGWRMTNPRMPTEWTISLGEGAEVLADKYSHQPGGSRTSSRSPPTGRRRRHGTRAGSLDEMVAVDGVDAGARRVHPGRLHAREAGRRCSRCSAPAAR